MPGARGWSVKRKPQSLIAQAVRELCALCPHGKASSFQTDWDRRDLALPEEGTGGWHLKVAGGERHILVLFFGGTEGQHTHRAWERKSSRAACMIRCCVDDRGWQEAGRAGPCENSLRAPGCPGGLGRA